MFFITVVEKREGERAPPAKGCNGGQWRGLFAYALGALTKTKPLTEGWWWWGGTVFMQGGGGAVPPPSLRAVLPAPAPFSSPFNHCLFTLSQELNEARLGGSPWEAPQAPPCPAFPIYPHRTPAHPPLSASPPPNNPTPANSTLAHKHSRASSLGEPASSPTPSRRHRRLLSLADTEVFFSFLFFLAISCSLRQTCRQQLEACEGVSFEE